MACDVLNWAFVVPTVTESDRNDREAGPSQALVRAVAASRIYVVGIVYT